MAARAQEQLQQEQQQEQKQTMTIDPLFMAIRLFRHRRFEDCANICSDILTKTPYDQVRLCTC